MSRPFRRVGDHIRMELEDYDLELLRALPRDLRDILDSPDPDDPVVKRLFPPYVLDDERADAEVRRLVYDDLLREKISSLEDLVKVLERGAWHRDRFRVELAEDEPAMFLGVLNDLRLTLGARIGIDHLDRDEVDERHPAAGTIAVIDHFGWLQHELLRLLDPASIVEDI